MVLRYSLSEQPSIIKCCTKGSPRLKQLSERDDVLRVRVPYLVDDSDHKRCYPGIRNGS